MLQISNFIGKLEKIVEGSFLFAIFILPFSIALVEISLTASFVAWLLLKAAKKEKLFQDQHLLILMALFLVTSSVSAFYSGYPTMSFKGIIKIIKFLLIFLIAADFFKNKRRLDHLLFTGGVSLIIVLVDSTAQLAMGKDLIHGFKIHYADYQIRLTGPYKFYGLLAAQLIAGLPLVLSAILTNSDKKIVKQLFLTTVFFAVNFILYKTHSRGAWIASGVSLIVYALLVKSKKILVFLFALIIVLPFVLPKNTIIHEDINDKEQSLIERYRLWERAGQVIIKRPLFGCGINTYTKNYPLYDEVKNWRVPGYYVHNGYLQLAAETGLTSLFLFLLVIGRSLLSGLKAIRSSPPHSKMIVIGIFCGCIALLIQAGVDTTLHNLQPATLIWLFLGLLMGSQFRDA